MRPADDAHADDATKSRSPADAPAPDAEVTRSRTPDVRPPDSPTLSLPPDACPEGATPTPTDMPKRLGRFEIRRYVGEGGFGRVYEAYDTSLKRIVALKIAKPEQMTSPERVKRFQREAHAAANLTHPISWRSSTPVRRAGGTRTSLPSCDRWKLSRWCSEHYRKG